MTLVRYVGDIHGHYGTYYQTIEKVVNSVQIGDYGFGFGPLPRGLVDLNKKPGTNHRFIRGNHDSPDECALQHNWIKDGTVETIEDYKVMYIGGAYSIDVAYRTPGVSWWPDEELSQFDLETLIYKYENEKPDVMITHEVPESMLRVVFPYKKIYEQWGSRTRLAFDEMYKIHKPKVWIFGHWHENADVVEGGTRFICIDCNLYIDFDYKTKEISVQKEINPWIR